MRVRGLARTAIAHAGRGRGFARRVINKAGSDATRLLDKTDAFIRRQPRVSGDTAQQMCQKGGGWLKRATCL